MSYSFRKMRINKRFESAPCAWCSHALALGEDGAICESCETPHHLKCWFDKNGCGNSSCINNPLPEVTMPPVPEVEILPFTSMRCPSCGKLIAANSRVCVICNAVLVPAGDDRDSYPYERTTVSEAKAALIYAILGFFCCGVFAFVALSKAKSAKDQIDANPEYQGRGMAVAGQIIAIITLVLWGFSVLGIIGRLGSTR